MLRNFVLYLIECRGIIPLVIIYYPFLYCWIWFANICLGLLCICVCVWYVSSSNFFCIPCQVWCRIYTDLIQQLSARFCLFFYFLEFQALYLFIYLFGVPSSLFILFYFIIFTMIFIFSIIADLQCSVSFLLYSGGLDVTDF